MFLGGGSGRGREEGAGEMCGDLFFSPLFSGRDVWIDRLASNEDHPYVMPATEPDVHVHQNQVSSSSCCSPP